jgi:hypothetical protein
VRERFDDGNYSAAPAWSADSVSGTRIAVAGGAIEVSRTNSRGATSGAGITLPVHIPVRRGTQIQFDVQVVRDSARTGCGINCASWPAVVRLRVKNSDLTESEVWYAFGATGGTSLSLGSVVIVGKGDAPAGEWLREQRFTVRDALPRADSILQVSVGGIGTDFSARFDNIYIPVPVLAAVAITPDSLVLSGGTPTATLRAVAKDSDGEPMPAAPAAVWSAKDTLIARVDSAGVVSQGTRIGHTWVKATLGGFADSVRVVVRSLRRAPARRPARRP